MLSIPRSVAAATLLVLVSVLAGCNATTQAPVPVPESSSSYTVSVQVGSIDSVVTLDATVVANPAYVISTPHSGRISYTDGSASVSAASARIATISDSGLSWDVLLPPFSEGPRWMVPSGALVTQGLPVASATYDGFAVEATVPNNLLYRFYGPVSDLNAEIKQGPGPFKCSAIGSIGSGSDGSVGSGADPATGAEKTTGPAVSMGTGSPIQPVRPSVNGPVQILCAPPRELSLFAGMEAILAATTAHAKDVLVLPVQAVAGSSQTGKVRLVLSNGTTEDRDVSLGITDGSHIEIKSGVKQGDVVQVPGPFLGSGN
jgi:hypothetical protein